MARFSLHIQPCDAEPFELQALEINAALAIIDINTHAGNAEIWDGDRCLARLRRRGRGAPFWEVD